MQTYRKTNRKTKKQANRKGSKQTHNICLIGRNTESYRGKGEDKGKRYLHYRKTT